MSQPESTGVSQEASSRLRSGLFTSDLTVDELVCLENLGMDPLGLVMGTSVYHVGYQYVNPNQSMEMGVLSQAMYHARQLAMTRMEEEADLLGADGVVGVRFDMRMFDWGPGLIEFKAIGTAIRARDTAQSLRPAHGRPYTSDLSGQDFWKLRYAGYRPVRLVMGSCVYHVGRQSVGNWFKSVSGRNVEMTNITQGLYTARELAMSRMEAEAAQVGAGGIVGVFVNEGSWGWESHVIEYFAIGTAVIKESQATPPSPYLMLPMGKE